ncbi:MAG: hydroxysqualene dehydroxylase HpnE [Deltaproteobacteria bacterium]|nr:hydroxysqualene dehydroxylase HpnE [Deltaproteobacteria bacterium]
MHGARKEVVVAGSGLSGLAAAVHLAKDGHAVTLVEAKPFLGGRTYSFRDKTTGDLVDNGQHVLTTTYTDTFEFLRIIGTIDLVWFPDQLQTFFKDSRYGDHWLRGPNLPGPLQPLAGMIGMLRLKSLTLADKLAVLRSLPKLAVVAGEIPDRLDRMTAEEWFDEMGFTTGMRRAFWDTFTISTLNEKPWRVSAHLLAQLLRWGFVAGRSGRASLGYPTVPLDELFVAPSARYLEGHGAKIIIGDAVAGVELDSKRITRFLLKSGRELTADAYLLALAPQGMKNLIAATALKDDPFFARVNGIEDAPIVAINLWYDQRLHMTNSYEGILDCPVEWVFDRTAMHGRESMPGRYYYTLIVSASWDLMTKTNAQIMETAMEAIHEHYPESRKFKLLHSSVVREPTATFSGVPGFRNLRCRQRTPIENLFLAGDWTDTELPSTMESAVRSGVKAVREARRYLNH